MTPRTTDIHTLSLHDALPISAVQAQVEQLKGQIQYYEESASMSAISVTLTPNALIQPIEVGGWQPQGVAKDALAALLRSEEHTSELQSQFHLVCRLLLEKKKI